MEEKEKEKINEFRIELNKTLLEEVRNENFSVTNDLSSSSADQLHEFIIYLHKVSIHLQI